MKQAEMTVSALFDLNRTLAKPLLKSCGYPWEALPQIGGFIKQTGSALSEEYIQEAADIWVHRTAKVAGTAELNGPLIVGENAEIRHCAFIRGNVLIGNRAVVGNSTELKNVILFDQVQVPHYNYVGDSILGYKSHLGAGAITSNVKSDRQPVRVHAEDGDIDTGIRKFGAILGDGVEVGCGSVLNPGTVIGKNSNIYPLSSVRGGVRAGSIYKKEGNIAEKRID